MDSPLLADRCGIFSVFAATLHPKLKDVPQHDDKKPFNLGSYEAFNFL
jgi:hypothetical protein